jgi:DNA polymerase-3 subunit delta'
MADPFEGVCGHQLALRLLQAQLESDRIAHAYLFHGEPGLGKTTIARRLATALLPELRLDRHPDYWEDDRAKLLSIDEVRLLPDKAPEAHQQSLQAFLSLKPGIASRRVAVIANVGRMRDETQGILLKTLEEPHPGRVIILTTPSLSPFVVLPTVVSRCRRLAFQPVPAPEVEALLIGQGIDPERASVLAQLSRGRPGWALTAAHDAELIARHRDLTDRLEQLFGAPADVALGLAAEIDSAQFAWRSGEKVEDDPAMFAVNSWQLTIRGRMMAQSGKAAADWARLLESSYDTLGYLEQNVSPRLALESFLLEARRMQV